MKKAHELYKIEKMIQISGEHAGISISFSGCLSIAWRILKKNAKNKAI